MTPPVVSATRRPGSEHRAAARRRSATRRRRTALGIVGIGLLLAIVALAMPLFRKAVNELTLPLHHQDIIRQQASEKRLDPALIAAVIYAETKFDPRPSSAGAEGLMQIMPETAAFLARRSGATSFTTSDLSTPQVNIAYGSYYLRYLLDEYGQNKVLALAAYNAGEANVDRWVADARAHDRRLTVAEIPFPETQAYVTKVLQAQHDYRTSYASELGYR
jgi:peptidoglycan lytic transglycosylase